MSSSDTSEPRRTETTAEMIALARDNERMKSALRGIRRFAENAAFGGWRFHVAALVDEGLSE